MDITQAALDECNEKAVVVENNVKAALGPGANAAIAGNTTPAQAAAQIHSEAKGLRTMLYNTVDDCHELLGDCPDIDGWANEMEPYIESVERIADILLGDLSRSEPETETPRFISC